MGGVTITVVRGGGSDQHGDPLPSVEHQIAECTVAPRPGAEDNRQGEVIIVGLTLFAPFDADIAATDRVRIENPKWAGTYDVVGEPGRWQNPFTNRRAGLEVALSRHG